MKIMKFDKKKIKDFLELATLHAYDREEHVDFMKRSMRSIKEKCRSTCDSIPYKQMTILVVRSLIKGIVSTLNIFPSKHGVSDTLNPSTIIEGKPKLDLNTKVISFDIYALIYAGTSNDMKSRAVHAIALRRSNGARGHYFMSLYPGKRIHGYSWDQLPIDGYVIERVESLAKDQGQPIIYKRLTRFKTFQQVIEACVEDL